jgi:hypothetical protein
MRGVMVDQGRRESRPYRGCIVAAPAGAGVRDFEVLSTSSFTAAVIRLQTGLSIAQGKVGQARTFQGATRGLMSGVVRLPPNERRHHR